MCVCMRACVHTCVCACARACVHAHVRVCVRACACVFSTVFCVYCRIDNSVGIHSVAESYILFCLLCYRLSVYTDSAVFNSKLCIILIWFMDCGEHVSFVALLLSVCEVS